MIVQHLKILENLSEGVNQEVVYLDFSKANGKVDHHYLLEKMSRHGFSGPLLAWSRAFLEGRDQVVKIGFSLYKPVWVRSGVPQGFLMGPLSF